MFLEFCIDKVSERFSIDIMSEASDSINQTTLKGTGRVGEPVSTSPEMLDQVFSLVKKGSLWEHKTDLGETMGHRLPEQHYHNNQNKTPINQTVTDQVSYKEDSGQILSRIQFTGEELMSKLHLLSVQEFWATFDEQGSLYMYLTETRKDGDELFEPIKHDLIAWIYGTGEKYTNSVEQFVKSTAIIATKLKKDLKKSPIMCSLIDFIGSQNFYNTYINSGGSVIDCFFDVKVRPSYDQQLVSQVWTNFKGVIKRNNSVEDYNLYTNGITLIVQENRDGSALLNWCFMYSGRGELAEINAHLFDGDLIYSFVEYAKGVLGLGAGFHKLIQIIYGYKNTKGRPEYDLKQAVKSKNRPKKIQTLDKLVIHDGNRDADSLLSRRLKDQLMPITEDTIKHCVVSGYKGSGKTTIIKHYLNELQYRFPQARIQEFSLEELAKKVSLIAQVSDSDLKAKGFDDFVKMLHNCDVIYINDFDKITKGKYRIKGELMKVINNDHVRLVLESDSGCAAIQKQLEDDSHTTIPDPIKRDRSKYYTKNLRLRLFNDAYEAVNQSPTPVARKNIIQNISQQKLGDYLSEGTANYLAGSLFQVDQCRKIINTIKHRIVDILTLDEVAKKVINENIGLGVDLQLSKVYDWFEDFADENKIPLNNRSEMFAAYAYIMTEEPSMWNPVPQYWKIEDIARHSHLRSKKPSHKKLREYFSKHRSYHEERCRFVSKRTGELMYYGGYALNLGGNHSENIINKSPSKQ